MITMNAIQWPEKWIPGETDNFVSNEVIVMGVAYSEALLLAKHLGVVQSCFYKLLANLA